MTEQDAKHIGEIFTAAALGQKIEYKSIYGGDWIDQCPWGQGSSLRNYPNNWRIKPKPKTRPWQKPDDVPGPICWLRIKHDSSGFRCSEQLITFLGSATVTFGGSVMDWKILENYEYSTDRKHWFKCEVTEDQP